MASTPEELEAAAKDATATSIALGADIDVASLEGGVLKDDYDSYRYKVLFDHSVTLDLNGHELTNSSSNESGKSGTIFAVRLAGGESGCRSYGYGGRRES